MKGWRLEPGRHALAAKGVPTGRKSTGKIYVSSETWNAPVINEFKKGDRRPYAFITSKGFRVEVYAKNVVEAFRESVKLLESMKVSPNRLIRDEASGATITAEYTTFGRNGVDTGWRSMSEEAIKKVGGIEGRFTMKN